MKSPDGSSITTVWAITISIALIIGAVATDSTTSSLDGNIASATTAKSTSTETDQTATTSPDDKRPFKVFRVQPHNETELKTITDIYEKAVEYELDFWKAPRGVGHAVDIMVQPQNVDKFKELLEEKNLEYIITIEDVEKEGHHHETNKVEIEPSAKAALGSFLLRRMQDSARGAKYDFNHYNSYEDMRRYMRKVESQNPSIAKVISIGRTHEGRSIEGMKIGNPVHSTAKKVVWIDGGIHAREWAASHTAVYFIHQLTSQYGRNQQMTEYVDRLNFIIVPLINPDGYEYTRSSRNPNIRLWRKNRSPNNCISDTWGRTKCCKGVDLNRNFDFHWSETGSSRDPCSEVFHGARPFSEPEARAVRDYILSQDMRNQVDAFITMHTYSQIWIHPYGHRRDNYPGDVNDLFTVGKRAAAALKKLYGTRYVVGSGADTLYPASGGSDDWAKLRGGVKYVYLLELRPDERHQEEADESVGEKFDSTDAISVSVDSFDPDGFKFGDGTPGSCYDLRFACKKWVRESAELCQTLRYFMRTQCAYSCQYC